MSTNTDERVEDGLGGTVPPEGGGEEGWLSEIDDDELREYAKGKQFSDPGAALKAQREAEQQLRREQEARADMERELAEYRDMIEAGADDEEPQAGAGGEQAANALVAEAHALAESFDDGRINTQKFVEQMLGMSLAASQQIADHLIQERLGEVREREIRPLSTRAASQDLNSTAAELKSTYGADYDEVAEDVIAMMNERGDFSPGGMKAAFGYLMAEKHAALAKQRRSEGDLETLDTSARSQQAQADAAEAIRKQMREAHVSRQDGLG